MDWLNSKDSQLLYKAILSLKNADECKKFLRDLLTEAEIKEFVNRWKVAQMLNESIDYEKITQATNMSSTTIARISKWLHKGTGGYQLILKRMKQNKRTKKIKDAHHTRLLAV